MRVLNDEDLRKIRILKMKQALKGVIKEKKDKEEEEEEKGEDGSSSDE
jgi:hypothetical protein